MTLRRTAVLGATAAILVALSAIAVASQPTSAAAPARHTALGPQGAIPQFTVECGWSNAAPIDPIVHPGHTGTSHLHDFFGNEDVASDSTASSLLDGATTCDNPADAAAYWAPALLDGGEPVEPLGAQAYYGVGPGVDPAIVQPLPFGLVVVSGDAEAVAPQTLETAAWHCGASPLLQGTPPVCPRTAPLGVRIEFPDCWDGIHLDSDDHRSHLAPSAGGACPGSHPVPITQLVLTISYPVWGDGHELELASGGVHGVHADFINAWDPEALEREVRVCLNSGNVCGVVSDRSTG